MRRLCVAMFVVGAVVLECGAFGQEAQPSQTKHDAAAFRKPARDITMTVPGFIWVDAEDFADYGGWLLDTQFVHLMGSAYLIAAGVGEPVADASVDVAIPESGVYRVWVRAKNWLPEYSPGQFRVSIGGKISDTILGAEPNKSEWLWRAVGDFALEKGSTRIALHDLTGAYGRCDALILTTDLGYVPPEGVDALRKERSRLTGLSLEPRDGGTFDVVVVGAGAAGSVAALASARMGAKTALVQNRPVLGGNSSDELGVSINGAASAHPNARESGIIEEAGRIKARYGHPRMSEAFRTLAEQEPNLSVFLNKHVMAAGMQDEKRIEYVEAVDTLSNEITRYRGAYFIDCTGDGWVGFYAGAKYRLGREAADEFGEDLAPTTSDTITMSGCLMGDMAVSFRATDSGTPCPYIAPPWASQLPPDPEFGRGIRSVTGGEWWLERPGALDNIADAERARDELIRISYGYWNHIKNEWRERDRAATYKLVYVPITEAKRESRRLIGDYVLTQNDVFAATVFPDRISYGGWPLDVHHPEGIFSGAEGPFYSNNRVPIYTIPFRCLYSVNVDNLLFAGRDVSVTHMALGTVRVQSTLATLGQAVGTAAALCLKHGVTPRALCQDRIQEIQQTLVKYDQYIPGIVNEDPLDLARNATLSASSTAQYDVIEKADALGDAHPLNMPRAVMFPVGVDSNLSTVSLALDSSAAGPAEVVLHLRAAAQRGDFSTQEDLATATAAAPPGKKTWVTFEFNRKVDAPFAWVWLPKTDGISWRLVERPPAGGCRAYGGTANTPWTVVEMQSYAFATEPPRAFAADYSVEQITNGVTRIIDDTRNLWASDSTQPMPQWVELGFDTPQRINTVYLTFDTDMNAAYHTTPLVPECVRDYDLACYDGNEWKTVAQVEGNFQRRRVHRFETIAASKLRLTVRATNGSQSARVFEIRAYEE